MPPGVIVPRLDLLPTGYKRLGKAVRQWARCAQQGDTVVWIDQPSLADLMAGEPPATAAVNLFRRAPKPGDRPLTALARRLGPKATDRKLAFALKGGEFDRYSAIELLKEYIPADLVVDVRIAGRSWDDL
jgi:hypothetical protein